MKPHFYDGMKLLLLIDVVCSNETVMCHQGQTITQSLNQSPWWQSSSNCAYSLVCDIAKSLPSGWSSGCFALID